MIRRLLLTAALSLMSATVLACAASQPSVMVNGQKMPLEDAANAAYQAAKQKQAAGDEVGARADFIRISRDFAGADKAAQAQFELAELLLRDGQKVEAKKRYGDFLMKYPTHPLAPRVRRAFSRTAIELGDYRDASETLKTVVDESQGDERKQVIADLLDSASRVGDAPAVLKALSEQLKDNNGGAQTQVLQARVVQTIDRDLAVQDIARMKGEVQQNASLQFAYDALLLKSARIYMHTGDYARAKEAAHELSQRPQGSTYKTQALAFLAQLEELQRVRPKVIGALLPLSGSKRAFGLSALAAIELALGIKGEGASPSGIELVVRDTEGDPEKAQRAVDELATKEHVAAIIGPLFSEESMAAAVRAETYGVPLINLSWRDGIPQVGPHIFRLCLTAKQQAQAVAKLAFDVLGYKRFAVLYPNHSIGTELANLFWDEVDKRQGEIRAAETFDYDQTTFMSPVKKLVGRHYLEARADYYKAMQQVWDNKLTGIKAQRARDQIVKSLPPVTDFDALFIPGNAKQVGYIAPALAFEDIVTTTDTEELKRIGKTTGRDDIQPVRLLGASQWNSMQTVERGGKFVEGAIFVDGFFADDHDPRVQKFVKRFTEATQHPPALPDAQAYDAAAILREAILKGPTDREALVRLISETKDFAGTTGKISFDTDGEALKELYLLTIDKGQIVKFEKKRGDAG